MTEMILSVFGIGEFLLGKLQFTFPVIRFKFSFLGHTFVSVQNMIGISRLGDLVFVSF